MGSSAGRKQSGDIGIEGVVSPLSPWGKVSEYLPMRVCARMQAGNSIGTGRGEGRFNTACLLHYTRAHADAGRREEKLKNKG